MRRQAFLHPSQVGPCKEIFSPTTEEIHYARLGGGFREKRSRRSLSTATIRQVHRLSGRGTFAPGHPAGGVHRPSAMKGKIGTMSPTSEFIRVDVNMNVCVGIVQCGGCVRVCPVGIFKKSGDTPEVVAKNEDECILCELCLQSCKPHAITIKKLYET
jgi:ferredoxin